MSCKYIVIEKFNYYVKSGANFRTCMNIVKDTISLVLEDLQEEVNEYILEGYELVGNHVIITGEAYANSYIHVSQSMIKRVVTQ